MIHLSVWTLLGFSLVMGAPSDSLQGLYHQGQGMFQKKKYNLSKQAFQKLLPKLEQRQKKRLQPKTRAWHLMTLGQCDVLYHLAQIAERQKKPRQACLLYQKLQQRFETVPGEWKQWEPNPNLPGRLQEATVQWRTFCPTVTSALKVSVIPKNAKVFVLTPAKKWRPLQQPMLDTLAQQVTLRFTVSGYLPKIMKNVRLKRWKANTVSAVLKKKPKPVVVARRVLPPPLKPTAKPVPLHKKWWIWTIAGVVVAAGVTAAIVVPMTAKNEESLQNDENGGPLRIW